MSTENCFYFWKNNGMLIGTETQYSQEHQHPNLQIFISLEKENQLMLCNGYWRKYNAVLVDFDVIHQFNANKNLHAILFIDPLSVAGRKIRKKFLSDNTICDLNYNYFSPFVGELIKFTDLEYGKHKFNQLFVDILNSLSENDASDFLPYDERILKSLEVINNSHHTYLSVKNLATEINIAETRFRHLFREQTGVSVRRYLLWQRTVNAWLNIASHRILPSELSDSTGFYDEDHFFHIFESMFGVNAHKLLDNPEQLNIVKLE